MPLFGGRLINCHLSTRHLKTGRAPYSAYLLLSPHPARSHSRRAKDSRISLPPTGRSKIKSEPSRMEGRDAIRWRSVCLSLPFSISLPAVAGSGRAFCSRDGKPSGNVDGAREERHETLCL